MSITSILSPSSTLSTSIHDQENNRIYRKSMNHAQFITKKKGQKNEVQQHNDTAEPLTFGTISLI